MIGQKLAQDNGPPTSDNGLITHLYCVDDADNSGVDRAILALERHPRGTTLHDEHDLIDAGSYGIDGDQVTLLILTLDIDHSRDQQFAAMKPVIFSRGNDSSDYSSKKHGSGQWSASLVSSPLATDNGP